MIYETDVLIPKNTSINAPVSVILPVHPGVLRQFEVYFPRGCAGLARVRVLYWSHPLFPSNPDGWFRGDDVLIRFDEDMPLPGAPYEFLIQGYNDDDTYAHTPIVRMSIIPSGDDLASLFRSFLAGPRGQVVAVNQE